MSTVWPILHYDAAASAVDVLVDVFGFVADVVAADDDGDVAHAELSAPGGGTVVVGSTKHREGVHGGLEPGGVALYVVTEDVDAVARRVEADRRARLVDQPRWTEFGNGARAYVVTVADPEGNLWTFGTYGRGR